MKSQSDPLWLYRASEQTFSNKIRKVYTEVEKDELEEYWQHAVDFYLAKIQ